MLSMPSPHSTNAPSNRTLSYAERATLCTHPVSKKLFTIMEEKKSNLAVAADVRTKAELLALADAVGPHICMLKTHIDIIDDFDQDLITQLKQKAHEHRFLICEDRKFADIGSTVQAQYAGGIYRIAEWADIIIAHAIAGPAIIDALAACNPHCALLLLTQMSSKDNLIDATYTHKACAWAAAYSQQVIGIIGQDAQVPHAFQLKCTPGINLQNKGDTQGQQYATPEHMIAKMMTDIIIVGRGIYQAADPTTAAQTYQAAGWAAYQKRCIS